MTEEEKKLRELLTKESVDAYRVIVIEECAAIADEYATKVFDDPVCRTVAAAIRALKDKP